MPNKLRRLEAHREDNIKKLFNRSFGHYKTYMSLLGKILHFHTIVIALRNSK